MVVEITISFTITGLALATILLFLIKINGLIKVASTFNHEIS